MGWNSWNKFGCNVSEDMIRRDGRRHGQVGHEGRRLSVRRDRRLLAGRARCDGNIVADPKTFQTGSKRSPTMFTREGLKFGSTPMPARNLRRAARAACGHEYQDALQYAAWGVDYLKYDWCNTTTAGCAGRVRFDTQCARCHRPAYCVEHLRVGYAKPWLWGKA